MKKDLNKGQSGEGEKKRGIVIKDKRYYLSARPLVSERKKKKKNASEGEEPRRQSRFGRALLRLFAVIVCLCFIVGVGGLGVLVTWMVESE